MNIVFNESGKLGKFRNREIRFAVYDELLAHGIEEPCEIACLTVGNDVSAVKCLVQEFLVFGCCKTDTREGIDIVLRLNSVDAEFDGQIIDLTVDFIAVDDVVEIL